MDTQLNHDIAEAAHIFEDQFFGAPRWQFKNGTLGRLDDAPPAGSLCAWDRSQGREVWYAR